MSYRLATPVVIALVSAVAYPSHYSWFDLTGSFTVTFELGGASVQFEDRVEISSTGTVRRSRFGFLDPQVDTSGTIEAAEVARLRDVLARLALSDLDGLRGTEVADGLDLRLIVRTRDDELAIVVYGPDRPAALDDATAAILAIGNRI